MKSIMWTYINEEKAVLTHLMESQKVAETMSLIPIEITKNILFVSSGSSNNIVRCAKNFIERYGVTNVTLFYPYEFMKENRMILKYPVEDTLVVGISQTGTSAGPYECLSKAKELGYQILTLTERPNTPIADIGNWTINFECGEEACNAKTKGYSASLLLLHLIAIELGKRKEIVEYGTALALRKELQESIDEIPSIIDKTLAWAKKHRKWARAPFFMVLGHDDNTGTALEGALKLLETSLIPAIASDIDEYAHGNHRLLEDKSYVILIHSQGQASEKMRKAVEYMRIKTPNRLVIRSTEALDKSKDEITLKPKRLTNSSLTSVVVFQVLAVLFPEQLKRDPNIEKNEDYITKLKSRTFSI